MKGAENLTPHWPAVYFNHNPEANELLKHKNKKNTIAVVHVCFFLIIIIIIGSATKALISFIHLFITVGDHNSLSSC